MYGHAGRKHLYLLERPVSIFRGGPRLFLKREVFFVKEAALLKKGHGLSLKADVLF
jgi:hypothetical protein